MEHPAALAASKSFTESPIRTISCGITQSVPRRIAMALDQLFLWQRIAANHEIEILPEPACLQQWRSEAFRLLVTQASE